MTPDELLILVRDGRNRFDGGETVDDLAHAMQTAALAMSCGAPPDLVAAALLHDIGHHPALALRAPGVAHSQIGAEALRPHFGERAAFVVERHVAAKRHLAATEASYVDVLSDASRASLDRQGGPKVLGELLDGWGPAAVELRRWDDAAKVAGAPEPSWPEVAAIVRSAVLR